MKQLIVNADDFGHTPGVNRGILDAHLNGIVTSTTVMVNEPDAPAGLDAALRDAPSLGLGLHFNLTEGRPVSLPSRVPSLVDDNGQFHHIRQWVPVIEQFNPDEIQREVHAQFDRFVALTGQVPDHLDAHHHSTYVLPSALATMLALADAHQLPMRNVTPNSGPARLAEGVRHVLPDLPEASIAALAERLEAVLTGHETHYWPAHLEVGFFDAQTALGDLLVILTNLPEDSITELMCHPGYVDEKLRSGGYVEEREVEHASLTHPATRECIAAEGIELITFGDLAQRGGAS